MGWRKDSTAGVAISGTEPLTADDIRLRDEEIRWLMRHEQRNWAHQRPDRPEGRPIMSEGTYAALAGYPPAQALTASTGTSASPGACLWSSATYTPINANATMAPSAWLIKASGTVTSTAGSQTWTLLPAIGTGTVNAARTPGIRRSACPAPHPSARR